MPSLRARAQLAFTFIALVGVLGACTDGTEVATQSITRDHAIVVAGDAGDFAFLNTLVEWTDVPCSNELEATVEDALAPPCLDGEAQGAVTAAFKVGGPCKRAWLRKDQRPAPLTEDLPLRRQVEVLGVMATDHEDSEVRLLFGHVDDATTGYWLVVSNDKIIAADRTCGSFENMLGAGYETDLTPVP